MTDQANTRAGIAARVRARFAEGVGWWAVLHPREGWQVTSRERGHIPTEARDGARFGLTIGPYDTRRRARQAVARFQGKA